jgi:hypothetical protein
MRIRALVSDIRKNMGRVACHLIREPNPRLNIKVRRLSKNATSSGFAVFDIPLKGFGRYAPNAFVFKRLEFRSKSVNCRQMYLGEEGGFHESYRGGRNRFDGNLLHQIVIPLTSQW